MSLFLEAYLQKNKIRVFFIPGAKFKITVKSRRFHTLTITKHVPTVSKNQRVTVRWNLKLRRKPTVVFGVLLNKETGKSIRNVKGFQLIAWTKTGKQHPAVFNRKTGSFTFHKMVPGQKYFVSFTGHNWKSFVDCKVRISKLHIMHVLRLKFRLVSNISPVTIKGILIDNPTKKPPRNVKNFSFTADNLKTKKVYKARFNKAFFTFKKLPVGGYNCLVYGAGYTKAFYKYINKDMGKRIWKLNVNRNVFTTKLVFKDIETKAKIHGNRSFNVVNKKNGEVYILYLQTKCKGILTSPMEVSELCKVLLFFLFFILNITEE